MNFPTLIPMMISLILCKESNKFFFIQASSHKFTDLRGKSFLYIQELHIW